MGCPSGSWSEASTASSAIQEDKSTLLEHTNPLDDLEDAGGDVWRRNDSSVAVPADSDISVDDQAVKRKS